MSLLSRHCINPRHSTHSMCRRCTRSSLSPRSSLPTSIDCCSRGSRLGIKKKLHFVPLSSCLQYLLVQSLFHSSWCCSDHWHASNRKRRDSEYRQGTLPVCS